MERPGRSLKCAVLGAILGLACASSGGAVVWEKPGASPEELERAQADCAGEAAAAYDAYETPSTGAGMRTFEFCMESKGWHRAGLEGN